MALIPLTRDAFAGKAWRRYADYRFAGKARLAPIGLAEVMHTCGRMPLAFLRMDGRYELAAMLSLQSEANLFVAPDGRWLGRYVPAAFRAYPFQIQFLKPGAGDWTLAFDDASGLLAEAGDADTEPFLDETGAPTAMVRGIADFLMQRHSSYAQMRVAVAALDAAGLIEPWPESADAGPSPGGGLFRVNAQRFASLDDADFLRLRHAGALPVAQAQAAAPLWLSVLSEMLALQRKIRSAAAATAKAAPPPAAAGLKMSIEDGQFKFD